MDNDKTTDFDESSSGKDTEFQGDTNTRARNRTVMLTPEVTGEVRARLAQDMSSAAYTARPASGAAGFESPLSTRGGGFSSPIPDPSNARSGGFAAPAYGAPMTTAAAAPIKEGTVWGKETALVGFLVSFDSNPNGTVFELRSGRLIVTSENPGTGNFLIVKDESVSPMHAIMRISASGEIQVLDQLSEFGTRVQRFGSEEEEELSGDKSTLEHGDVIKFGNRRFHVCLITMGSHS
jgi:hypothetical protein